MRRTRERERERGMPSHLVHIIRHELAFVEPLFDLCPRHDLARVDLPLVRLARGRLGVRLRRTVRHRLSVS